MNKESIKYSGRVIIALWLSTVIMLTACNTESGNISADKPSIKGNEEAILATIYNHYSAEYRALAWQAFNIASERILDIASVSESTDSLAIVADIDETLLDNSPHQALTILTGNPYPAGWNEWCSLSAAESVPGAVDFLTLADSLGFTIFYVSNRNEDPLYEPTYRNLVEKGFPQVSEKSLLLRKSATESNPDPSDKETRREYIESAGYSIVIYAGDNIGDFYSDTEKGDKRLNRAEKDRYSFGTTYIVLPNPMYGNWPSAAGTDGTSESYARLLYRMTEPFRNE
jgi:5'-nucleotidase (lipoprotein e(P4) family)